MHLLDYLVIASIIVIMFIVSFRLRRRAGRSSEEFILAGRKMPWWLAGIAVAAGQLNANNILQDTRKAREDGIGGMWFSWTQMISQAIGTAWFYRLWRRAGFNTQMEFYTARYTGWQAHFTRVFDSVLFGGVISLIWGALGLIGIKKALHVLFEIPATLSFLGVSLPTDWVIVSALVALSLVFTALAGVHGVVWNDLIEFIIAITATYVLFLIVWHHVGYGDGLRERLRQTASSGAPTLDFLPSFGFIFLYYLFIGPFLTQGCWSPAVQRFLCVKSERDVVYTAVFNCILTFAIRGVPFIIIGLAAWTLVPDSLLLAKYPALQMPDGSLVPDRERIYPLLAMKFLPTGLLGMTIGAFLCAFITSLNTNIHNSTAVFVNDLYRAYLRPGKTDHHYITAGRVYMVFATLITIIIGACVDNILRMSMLTIAMVTAAGLVKLLRFVWWRINGDAEVAAQVTSIVGVIFFLLPLGEKSQVAVAHWLNIGGNDGFFVARQVLLMLSTTSVAVLVALLTRPEPSQHLANFYRLVRPFGFWGPVASANQGSFPDPIGLQIGLTFAVMALMIGSVASMIFFFLAMWIATALGVLVIIISYLSMQFIIEKIYPETDELLQKRKANTLTASTN